MNVSKIVLTVAFLFCIATVGAVDNVDVTPTNIIINESGLGHGNVSFCATNHSRIVSIWAVNYSDYNAVIAVGKDGQYMHFNLGEFANFSMGISPDWNQTLEIYTETSPNCHFELWGMIVPGVHWVDGNWEIDNPEQGRQVSFLATVGEAKGMNPEVGGGR